MSFTDNEPALTASGLVALVTAVIALAVAFGAPITAQQKEAIIGVVAVVAPIAVALLVRPHVTPTAKLEETIAAERVQAVEAAKVRADQ